MKFLKWLLTGEVVFAGFLFSSVFKGMFENLPFDLTALFMVLSVIIAARRLRSSPFVYKKTITPISIYAILSLLMILSVLFTPSPIYGAEKTVKFITITAWSFIGGILLIKNHKSLLIFLRGLIFYGLLTIVCVAYEYFNNQSISYGRIGIDGDDNVLGLGRLAAVTALIIATLSFYEKKKFKQRLTALIGFCLAVFVLLNTGSRMPFLSFIISLSVLIPISFNVRKSNIFISKRILPLITLGCFSVLALIPLYFNGFFSTMFTRISKLFTQIESGTSVAGRTDRFQSSLDMWTESPILGKGIGSFSMYYNGVDTRSYSHNIFLEALSELGILGFLCISLLILGSIISIVRVIRNGYNTSQISIILIFIYLLINANSTGDFNDNRMLFTFIALTYMLPFYKSLDNKSRNVCKERYMKSA